MLLKRDTLARLVQSEPGPEEGSDASAGMEKGVEVGEYTQSCEDKDRSDSLGHGGLALFHRWESSIVESAARTRFVLLLLLPALVRKGHAGVPHGRGQKERQR